MMKYFLIALLGIKLWAIDPMDIKNLREEGVKVAIGDEEAKLIPRNMHAEKFLTATELDFNEMRLSFTLPPWIKEMKNLQELHLNATNINISALKSIKGLNITELDLSDNPNLFHSRENIIPILNSLSLTTLNLSNTGANEKLLYSLGTSVSHLTNLNLSNNRISNLKNLFLENSSIENLNVSLNFIKSFSTNQLPKNSLKTLDLSNNDIRKFDFNGDFPNLISLNLENNLHLRIDTRYKNNSILSNLNKNRLKPKTLISKFFTNKEKLNLVNGKFEITEQVKLKYSKLINLILHTESMDDEERQYWFDILPNMTKSQSKKLHTILDTEKKKLKDLDDKYSQEMKELNEEYSQKTITNNDYSVIDNVSIPYGKCALIVKSEDTIEKVRNFITYSDVTFNINNLKVFLANNGWYGISLKIVDKSESKKILSQLKQSGKIPSDSFCSTGKTYLKEVKLNF